jgi:hypothetical protein
MGTNRFCEKPLNSNAKVLVSLLHNTGLTVERNIRSQGVAIVFLAKSFVRFAIWPEPATCIQPFCSGPGAGLAIDNRLIQICLTISGKLSVDSFHENHLRIHNVMALWSGKKMTCLAGRECRCRWGTIRGCPTLTWRPHTCRESGTLITQNIALILCSLAAQKYLMAATATTQLISNNVWLRF